VPGYETMTGTVDLEPTDAELLQAFETERARAADESRRKALEAVDRLYRDGDVSKKAAYCGLLGVEHPKLAERLD